MKGISPDNEEDEVSYAGQHQSPKYPHQTQQSVKVLQVSLNKKGDTHTEHIVTSTTHDKTTINVNIQTKQIQHVNQDSN